MINLNYFEYSINNNERDILRIDNNTELSIVTSLSDGTGYKTVSGIVKGLYIDNNGLINICLLDNWKKYHKIKEDKIIELSIINNPEEASSNENLKYRIVFLYRSGRELIDKFAFDKYDEAEVWLRRQYFYLSPNETDIEKIYIKLFNER